MYELLVIVAGPAGKAAPMYKAPSKYAVKEDKNGCQRSWRKIPLQYLRQ
jgi:alkyl hydroperoxide reductase subunit AhpF